MQERLQSLFIFGLCNLKCSFCDTEFDKFINLHIDVLKQITELAANTIKLVSHYWWRAVATRYSRIM